MPKIFISYRRDDSEFQSHFICRALREQFDAESVFMDVDTIPLGVDFRKHLTDYVDQCDVLLAMIGNQWLDARSEDGQRRLDSPEDFVRIEIEEALSRDIPVVPVLMGRVSMPKERDLPAALAELAYRNAVEVRSGRDFDGDVDRMIRGIMWLLKTKPKAASSPTEAATSPAKERHETAQLSDSASKSPAVQPPRKRSKAVPTTLDKPRTQPQQPKERTLDVKCECGTVLRVKEKHWGKKAKCPKCSRTVNVPVLNSIGMKFTLIPAGEFMMGSPHHRVKITKPFYLGVYPVTQAEYEEVMGSNPSRYKGNDRRPVETVNWFDAVSFCNKLSELEKLPLYYEINKKDVSVVGGSGYRLPTEAEWEYACRAGTTTKWSFGDDESKLGEYAWYGENARDTTPPVGEKMPNPWGLFDMHGNVWEWCWDRFGEYNTASLTDPLGPKDGASRVLRGGAFNSQPVLVRSAYRSYLFQPDDRDSFSGFRPARTYN